MLLTSCSNNQVSSEVEITSDNTLASSQILMATDGTYASDLTTYETVEAPYTPHECEFDIDPNRNTISAHYEDGGRTIDYDLKFYDYGVTEAGVYSSSARTNVASRPLDIGDGWFTVVFDDYMYSKTIDVTNEDRINCVVESLSSYGSIHISENENVLTVAESLGEIIDVFPYAQTFEYNMSEYDNRSENDTYVTLYSPNVDYVYQLSSDTNLTRYVLRENLNGLPVGESEGHTISSRIEYGDYRGSISNMYGDVWQNDCSYPEDSLAVDIRYYNFDSYELEGDLTPIVPLTECVSNSLIDLGNWGFEHAYVYGAELIYIPFSKGANSAFEPADEVIFVPVWALYYTGIENNTGDHYLNRGAVYLNAFTGERLPMYEITG